MKTNNHKNTVDKRLALWSEELESQKTLVDALHIANELRAACKAQSKRWADLLEMAEKECSRFANRK